MTAERRWRRVVRLSRNTERDTDEEFTFHIEERVVELMEQGYDRASAERVAAERFGDRQRWAAACRGAERRRGFQDLAGACVRDVRRAGRNLARQPAFSVPAVVVLATGLAVTVAVAALLRAYLFSPFPYPAAERLMELSFAPRGAMARPDAPPVPDGLWDIEWPVTDPLIEASAAWDLDGFTLLGADRPEEVEGAWVSPGYFSALQPPLALGRPLAPDPDAHGAREAVISHALWQRRFNGDTGILGTAIHAFSTDRPDEAEAFIVVGVLDRGYWHINRFTDLLLQLHGPRLPSLIRVRPGVTAQHLADHLTAYARERLSTDPRWRLGAERAGDAYVAEARPALLILGGTTGLILLIVGGNLGTLLLARATARERVFAMHSALGARPAHLWGQVFAEGLVLSAAAGSAAVVTAGILLPALGPTVERHLGLGVPGGTDQLGLDAVVLLTAVAITIGAAGAFGTLPALIATRVDVLRLLGGTGPGGSSRGRQRRVRTALLMGEVALSFTLLVLAGLMYQSARHLGELRFGFDTDVVHGRFMLRERSYPEPETRRVFADRLLARLEHLPGVERVALADAHPMRQWAGSYLDVPGETPPEALPRAVHHEVSDAYFKTLGIPLLAGRSFDSRDGPGSAPVVIVSEDLASRLWPGRNPIGQRLRRGLWNRMPPDTLERWRTVIGVVGTVRKHVTAPAVPDTYVPLRQTPRRVFAVLARSGAPVETVTASIEAALWELDPTVPLTTRSRLIDVIDRSLSRPRFVAHLLSVLAAFAFALAVFGLYAVVAYQAAQRERDIAIRMALGARRGSVVTTLIGETARVVVVGIVVGGLLATVLAGRISGELHGVTPHDPVMYGGMAIILGLAAVAAAAVPARKASRVDPARLLRGS